MLTDTQKQGIALGAKEELARRFYADYFMLANSNDNVKMFPHTKYICDRLQDIIDGQQKFLILELPPQHGKSMTVTETFPSYYLMRYPDKKVMVTAYAQDLYTRFNKKNRNHYQYWSNRLFGLKMGKNTSQEFDVLGHDGEAYFTSILGGGTGRPANLLIIDDPIKDYKEASSPTVKDSIWNEWTSTFSTRLQKGASVIVIMTRWQTDDLAGRLLDKMDYPWEEIKFPAIATDIPASQTDAIGRHNGEALCPELHPIDDLLAHKKNMGTQKFTALYQQSPTIEGGNVFKLDWFHFYVPDRETMVRYHLTDKDAVILPKHFDDEAQSWDATFKSGENDDFVAGQVWKRRGSNFFLMPDFVHARLSFTETVKAIRQITRLYPNAFSKFIEDKANGSAIIDTLKDEISGIVPVEPQGGKVVRAAAVTALWEAGNVFIPHPAWCPRIQDWMQEVLGFPNMPHDDNVDSMTQGLTYMRQHETHMNRFMDY